MHMKQKLLVVMLALLMGNYCLMAQERELKTEDDGFQWYQLRDNGVYGVQDKSGKTLIPLSRGYTRLYYFCGKFHVGKNDYAGACDLNGHEAIPLSRGYDNVCFHTRDGIGGYYTVMKNDFAGACDINGKEVISPSRGYTFVCFHNQQGHVGYFGVEKNEMKGACDVNGKEIIAPQYKSLFYSTNGFTSENSQGYYAVGMDLDSQGNAFTVNVETSNNSNSSSYSSSSSTYSSTPSTPTVKELFEEAYNTPNSEAQLKFDRYQKVLQADPTNVYGYKSLVLNNIGCLYDNLGDKKNARAYFEAALTVNPNNENAKSNLKNVKREIRNERLSNIGNALSTIGNALGNMNTGQIGGSYNSYQGTSGTYGNSSGGYSGGSSSNVTKSCSFCAGSGKCSGSRRCRGSGKCNYCNGEKITSTAGHYHECGACHGSGKCSFCNGSGRCKHCGGTGKG